MKLVFICSEYPPAPHGGIGVVTQVLARHLTGLGHQVRVLGAYRRGYHHPSVQMDEGVEIRRVCQSSIPRFGWLVTRLRLFQVARRWSREEVADLIEVPDWQGPAAGWWKLATPVITRVHGSATYVAAETGRRPARLLRYLEGASIGRSDSWCAVSRYAADRTQRLFGLDKGPDAVLYNPVGESSLTSVPARERESVVFAGTLVASKGIASLAQAWLTVIEHHPRATLDVFGKDGRTADGRSMTEHVKNLLGDNALSTVRFHGQVSRERVMEAFHRARVTALPSFAEAFAMTPLEAMSTGCPTVFTRRASGPETLEDGVSGLLVEPDNPSEIASAILRLFEDDQLAGSLSEAAHRRVRSRFSLRRIAVDNLAYYEQTLASFKGLHVSGYRRVHQTREQ